MKASLKAKIIMQKREKLLSANIDDFIDFQEHLFDVYKIDDSDFDKMSYDGIIKYIERKIIDYDNLYQAKLDEALNSGDERQIKYSEFYNSFKDSHKTFRD